LSLPASLVSFMIWMAPSASPQCRMAAMTRGGEAVLLSQAGFVCLTTPCAGMSPSVKSAKPGGTEDGRLLGRTPHFMLYPASTPLWREENTHSRQKSFSVPLLQWSSGI
jgi:hypothetical protein